MASAKEYRKELTNLGIDGLEISASSVIEAKAALKQCRDYQRKLRLLKNH